MLEPASCIGHSAIKQNVQGWKIYAQKLRCRLPCPNIVPWALRKMWNLQERLNLTSSSEYVASFLPPMSSIFQNIFPDVEGGSTYTDMSFYVKENRIRISEKCSKNLKSYAEFAVCRQLGALDDIISGWGATVPDSTGVQNQLSQYSEAVQNQLSS